MLLAVSGAVWAEGNQKHALGKSLANADNEQIVKKI